ncbi:hypothetical protein FNG98_19880 [Salmonella enterica]|nr:hypothetical protein [Salmonella enterica]
MEKNKCINIMLLVGSSFYLSTASSALPKTWNDAIDNYITRKIEAVTVSVPTPPTEEGGSSETKEKKLTTLVVNLDTRVNKLGGELKATNQKFGENLKATNQKLGETKKELTESIINRATVERTRTVEKDGKQVTEMYKQPVTEAVVNLDTRVNKLGGELKATNQKFGENLKATNQKLGETKKELTESIKQTRNNLGDLDKKISSWQNMATRRMENMDKQIAENHKEMKQATAQAVALAGLFQPYNVGKFNITAAVGGYSDQQAIAIGSGYRFSSNIAAKAGVAFSGGDPSWNVGMNFEF